MAELDVTPCHSMLCIVIVLLLYLPFAFLLLPILYSWQAYLERFWKARRGALDLAAIE